MLSGTEAHRSATFAKHMLGPQKSLAAMSALSFELLVPLALAANYLVILTMEISRRSSRFNSVFKLLAFAVGSFALTPSSAAAMMPQLGGTSQDTFFHGDAVAVDTQRPLSRRHRVVRLDTESGNPEVIHEFEGLSIASRFMGSQGLPCISNCKGPWTSVAYPSPTAHLELEDVALVSGFDPPFDYIHLDASVRQVQGYGLMHTPVGNHGFGQLTGEGVSFAILFDEPVEEVVIEGRSSWRYGPYSFAVQPLVALATIQSDGTISGGATGFPSCTAATVPAESLVYSYGDGDDTVLRQGIRRADGSPFSGAIVCFMCRSRHHLASIEYLPASDNEVRWGNAEGVVAPNVDVRAFSVLVDGQIVDRPYPANTDHPTRTAADGTYSIPPEFFDPYESFEVRRGLRCRYKFSYPTEQDVHEIVTYCGGLNSPFGASVDVSGTQPPSAEELRRSIEELGTDFNLALPVIFQPGWKGGISHGEDLRQYMEGDFDNVIDGIRALATGGTVQVRKHAPAMPLFTVPNENGDDGLPWGYNNDMSQASPRMLARNGTALAFMPEIATSRLADFVPDGEVLPYSLVSHSYGGLITRAAQNLDVHPIRPQRYVALDTVEGGLQWVIDPVTRYVYEGVLNGFNHELGGRPIRLGWGRRFTAPTSHNRLSYSASAHIVVQPPGAAFGVSRTALSTREGNIPLTMIVPPNIVTEYFFQTGNLYLGGANGDCARTAGGWEELIPNLTHTVQDVDSVQRELVAFLYDSRNRPPGAVFAESLEGFRGCDGGDSQFLGTEVPDSVDLNVRLEAAKGESVISSIGSERGRIQLQATLEGDGARLELLDSGVVIAPVNERAATIAPGVELVTMSFDVPVTGGPLSLRLVARTDSEAVASVAVSFVDRPEMRSGIQSTMVRPDVPVVLSATLTHQGSVLADVEGDIRAYISGPTGSSFGPLAFRDDGKSGDGSAGDGVFGLRFSDTLIPGEYQYRIEANVISSTHGSFVRNGSGIFDVKAEDFVITSFLGGAGVDEDGNGLFERFEARFQVISSRAGHARVSAWMEGPKTKQQHITGEIFNQAGSSTVTFEFPASYFHRKGAGEYLLTNIFADDQVNMNSETYFNDVALGYIDTADYESLPAPSIARVRFRSGHGPIEGGNDVEIEGRNLIDVIRVTVGGREAELSEYDRILAETTAELAPDAGRNVVFKAPSREALPSGVDSVKVDITVYTRWGEATLTNGYTYERSGQTGPGSNTGDEGGGGGGGCSAAPPSGPMSWRDIAGGGGWLAALVLFMYVRSRRSQKVATQAA